MQVQPDSLPPAEGNAHDKHWLTTHDAAAQSGVNERTIRRAIARGELIATRHGGRLLIAPHHLHAYALRQRATRGAPPSPGSWAAPLPVPAPPTAIIGREREERLIAEMLAGDGSRLLTLTGPGGVGKTRLALAAASAAAPFFAHGVLFVPLDAVHDPEQVAAVIAQRLGIQPAGGASPRETLLEMLGYRSHLLVLDNFEHLLAAAPFVAEMLAAAPGLRLLVTSREALHLRSEVEITVPPLALPDPALETTAAVAGRAPAIALFVQRARDVSPAFQLTDANAPAVSKICHRLDGLPLAIELAAAKMKHADPALLLTWLAQRLDTLQSGPRDLPARQQTLRATIAWSYSLLPAAEQARFRHLAVFTGSFDAHAAEQVWNTPCDLGLTGPQAPVISFFRPAAGIPPSWQPFGHATPPLGTLASLHALVDKSLLHAGYAPDGERTYHLLETIREFASEQLAASGEEVQYRDRHAAYFLGIAAEAARGYHTAGEPWTFAQIARHLDNLNEALRWTTREGEDVDIGAAMQLTNALFWFWYVRGQLGDGWRWYQQIIHDPRAAAWPAALAECVAAAGHMAVRQLMSGEAQALLHDAVERLQRLGDEAGEACARCGLGYAALQVGGDPVAAIAILREALAQTPDTHTWQRAATLNALTFSLLAIGEHEQAAISAEETLALSRADGDQQGTGATLVTLGLMARDRGELAGALQVFREALTHYQGVDDRANICICLEAIAGVLIALGQAAHGAWLLGATAALRRRLGMPVPVNEAPRLEQDIATARLALPPDVFTAAWEAGEAATLQEIIAHDALKDVAGPLAAMPAGADSAAARLATLTRREHQVLALVGAGHSDRQIGERLYISPTTVTRHVGNVLRKLGVHSRTAAAMLLLTTNI
ncbi:MAG: LuxR C-terminal-related transcriptional regulator [Chloroflexota bacterium]|nr:LuxR C-terminal-related transcriptional regulator [Chloroflexota bacterium]